VVQKLLRKARNGMRLIYIPGNHDEFLRGYYGTHFGGIEIVENAVHDGADGKCYLVVHGDMFDLFVTQARWLALLGDKAYEFALTLNRQFNALRRVLRRALLVAIKVGEAQGEERRRFHRRLRESVGDRSAQTQGRRRHLRPHSHARAARPLRSAVRQLRRLNGGCRTPRRTLRDHSVG
jgi:UDP-2,3-diacylglucosamine pyrophosphatase LpxH